MPNAKPSKLEDLARRTWAPARACSSRGRSCRRTGCPSRASTSTWIHWWSPVTSANWSISFWVTSCHSLVPRSLPSSVVELVESGDRRHARHYRLRIHGRTAARRRRPAPALPRVLRAAGLDHRPGRPARQRAAGLGQRDAAGDRGARAARDRHVLRRRGGRLPDRRVPRLPRRPPADAGRARVAVGEGPGAVRGVRVDRARPRRARGRRPPALARAGRRSARAARR